MGSIIAAGIRDAILREVGLTCCAGIGHSKLLAKLVGEVHKPNKQTTIFPEQANKFLSSLEIRRIPGNVNFLNAKGPRGEEGGYIHVFQCGSVSILWVRGKQVWTAYRKYSICS